MNKIFFVAALFAVLYFSQSCYALIGTIQPPRMILRGNTSGSVTGFVDVINSNNVSVNVSIEVTGDIANITNISETNLALQPNETKRVNFETYLPYTGQYIGEILFAFSAENEKTQGAALSSTIIVFAEGNSTNPGTNETNQSNGGVIGGSGNIISEGVLLTALILIAAVVVIAAALSYRGHRRRV